MIRIADDGLTKVLCFDDWTSPMMTLASVLWDLPPHPDAEPPATHEYGIDQLAKMPHAELVLDLLYDYAVTALEFRPDEDEVIELGKTLLQMNRELTELRRSRRRRPPARPARGKIRAAAKCGSEERR